MKSVDPAILDKYKEAISIGIDPIKYKNKVW